MGYTHARTPSERMAWVSYVLAHAGEYGAVTALSRTARVSRQTLYSWMERGQAALEQAFAPPVAAAAARLEWDILTLLVEGHASYRGIQRCLRQVGRRQVSLGTISAVVQEAERRALALVARTAPPQERAVALDEIYGRDRRGAYLNVVDVESGAVWAAEGPLPVDGETWTLVLWLAQERGLRVRHAVSDGGVAMAQGLRTAAPPPSRSNAMWGTSCLRAVRCNAAGTAARRTWRSGSRRWRAKRRAWRRGSGRAGNTPSRMRARMRGRWLRPRRPRTACAT